MEIMAAPQRVVMNQFIGSENAKMNAAILALWTKWYHSGAVAAVAAFAPSAWRKARFAAAVSAVVGWCASLFSRPATYYFPTRKVNRSGAET